MGSEMCIRDRGENIFQKRVWENNRKRFEVRNRMLDDLRTEFRNSNELMRESLRRQDKTARNEDIFMMLQVLKPGTEEYENIKTEMYNRILPDTGSGGANVSL